MKFKKKFTVPLFYLTNSVLICIKKYKCFTVSDL